MSELETLHVQPEVYGKSYDGDRGNKAPAKQLALPAAGSCCCWIQQFSLQVAHSSVTAMGAEELSRDSKCASKVKVR